MDFLRFNEIIHSLKVLLVHMTKSMPRMVLLFELIYLNKVDFYYA